MGFWSAFAGTVTVTLTGAEPECSLNRLSYAGVQMMGVQWEDDLTVRFCCSRRDRRTVTALCEKTGDVIRFSRETGWHPILRRVKKRPVLAAGVTAMICATLVFPTRVFLFQVEGNETIPDRRILAAAEECGIRFGVSRRSVRSEKMKNALLEAMPQLKWAGINTYGCRAVISVRERQLQEDQKVSAGVSSIAAVRDGYITSCTATRGSALCAPGQVVRKGQILISGFTDLGICIQATDAQGEVYAQTNHFLQAVTPADVLVRMEETDRKRNYSLVVGKKRINLWKDSGIWDATCGRMYEEYYITLPGGFSLPVRIGVETLTRWNTVVGEQELSALESDYREFVRKSVLEQMVAGTILREDQYLTREEGRFLLTGRFLCSEMIGRVITEEIGETDGKTD